MHPLPDGAEEARHLRQVFPQLAEGLVVLLQDEQPHDSPGLVGHVGLGDLAAQPGGLLLVPAEVGPVVPQRRDVDGESLTHVTAPVFYS